MISIPSYVDSCNIFLALVPPLRHSESGKLCDYESWLERGWCRAAGADLESFSFPTSLCGVLVFELYGS